MLRPPSSVVVLMVVAIIVAVGCTDDGTVAGTGSTDPSQTTASEPTEGAELDPDPATEATTAGAEADEPAGNGEPEDRNDRSEPELEPTTVTGAVVSAGDGRPLPGATVSSTGGSVVTGQDGRFELEVPASASITVERPPWLAVTVEVAAEGFEELAIELSPRVTRGLRVAPVVAGDPERFEQLLQLTDDTTVNALVFDTKEESGSVVYRTDVAMAAEVGAENRLYDPETVLSLARERDLYSITRIVTFEDTLWAAAVPEGKLAGSWMDATNEDNWDYPIALAVEACELGFDEVQFDYVRFPAGRTAVSAAAQIPDGGGERAEIIARFLQRARAELTELGCGISAAIFGIVMSSETDEGIGQTPETISAVTDAVSPMIYPSHYSRGWLGFDDPNDHPGPVVADALDLGGQRVDRATAVRPWLQGFSYNGEQVMAQIEQAEQRGAGWLIWNVSGNYSPEWLPPS